MKSPNEAPVVARNWRGETPEERRVQRRDRLVEAAMEAFSQHGIEKTTIRDICAQARLTERYFYESFRSTEEAFDTVYAQLKQQLVERVTTAMGKAPLNVPALAEAGLRAFYTFIKEDPRRAKIMLIDAFYANRRSLSKSRDAVKEYVAIVDRLSKVLYPHIDPDFDIELVAWGLVGMAIQVGTNWASNGFKQSIDKILRHNLYAWRGLASWLDAPLDTDAPSRTAAPAPKKAKALKAGPVKTKTPTKVQAKPSTGQAAIPAPVATAVPGVRRARAG